MNLIRAYKHKQNPRLKNSSCKQLCATHAPKKINYEPPNRPANPNNNYYPPILQNKHQLLTTKPANKKTIMTLPTTLQKQIITLVYTPILQI